MMRKYFQQIRTVSSKLFKSSLVPFPKKFKSTMKDVFRRLFRVYAHLFYQHGEYASRAEISATLNSSFKHFYMFIREFDLVPQKELEPLSQLIQRVVEIYKLPDKYVSEEIIKVSRQAFSLPTLRRDSEIRVNSTLSKDPIVSILEDESIVYISQWLPKVKLKPLHVYHALTSGPLQRRVEILSLFQKNGISLDPKVGTVCHLIFTRVQMDGLHYFMLSLKARYL